MYGITTVAFGGSSDELGWGLGILAAGVPTAAGFPPGPSGVNTALHFCRAAT